MCQSVSAYYHPSSLVSVSSDARHRPAICARACCCFSRSRPTRLPTRTQGPVPPGRSSGARASEPGFTGSRSRIQRRGRRRSRMDLVRATAPLPQAAAPRLHPPASLCSARMHSPPSPAMLPDSTHPRLMPRPGLVQSATALTITALRVGTCVLAVHHGVEPLTPTPTLTLTLALTLTRI